MFSVLLHLALLATVNDGYLVMSYKLSKKSALAPFILYSPQAFLLRSMAQFTRRNRGRIFNEKNQRCSVN
jgi:hypothetical protein